MGLELPPRLDEIGCGRQGHHNLLPPWEITLLHATSLSCSTLESAREVCEPRFSPPVWADNAGRCTRG